MSTKIFNECLALRAMLPSRSRRYPISTAIGKDGRTPSCHLPILSHNQRACRPKAMAANCKYVLEEPEKEEQQD
jgi:hypothetical protein